MNVFLIWTKNSFKVNKIHPSFVKSIREESNIHSIDNNKGSFNELWHLSYVLLQNVYRTLNQLSNSILFRKFVRALNTFRLMLSAKNSNPPLSRRELSLLSLMFWWHVCYCIVNDATLFKTFKNVAHNHLNRMVWYFNSYWICWQKVEVKLPFGAEWCDTLTVTGYVGRR